MKYSNTITFSRMPEILSNYEITWLDIHEPQHSVYNFSFKFNVESNEKIYEIFHKWFNERYCGYPGKHKIIGDLMLHSICANIITQQNYHSVIITNLYVNTDMKTCNVSLIYDYCSKPITIYNKLNAEDNIQEELNNYQTPGISKINKMIHLANVYSTLEKYCKNEDITIEDLKNFKQI